MPMMQSRHGKYVRPSVGQWEEGRLYVLCMESRIETHRKAESLRCKAKKVIHRKKCMVALKIWLTLKSKKCQYRKRIIIPFL